MQPRITKTAYLAWQGIAFTFMAAVTIWVSVWITGMFHNLYHASSRAEADCPYNVITPVASAYTFEELLDAIEWVESKGRADAKGDWVQWVNLETGFLEGVYRAIGSFQLWKIYVDEVNRICGVMRLTERFTYDDRSNKSKSRKMSLIHNEYWADIAMLVTDMDYAEAFVRSHQGACGYRTESTKAYWLRVKGRMEQK